MDARSLHQALQSATPPLLLNVLPEDAFGQRHISGSLNACVYEIAFEDKVRQLIPEFATPVVAYGAGGRETDVAVQRLKKAGYVHAGGFPGGCDEWAAAGFSLEGAGSAPSAPADGVFRVNPADSVIRWTGRNLFNHHHGTVRLADGEVTIRGGELISGKFEVDLRTIACEDLADDSLRATLVRHLMHSDFFDVGRFPLATYEVSGATPIPGPGGHPNFHIDGNFTLRGIRKPLSFDAVIASAPDGARFTAQAQREVDRTEFGSEYGSAKFFRFLGPHLVNDHFHIHLKIHADRCP